MFFTYKVFKKTIASLLNFRKPFVYFFIIINIVIMYTILVNVAVISDNKIVNYSVLAPMGKEYTFEDIAEIDAGVCGEKNSHHSKGSFYYSIELKDGTKIYLTDLGGIRSSEDIRSVIQDLDIKFLNMHIPKKSSLKYFEYSKEHLAKQYTDVIQKILKNTRD